MIVTLSKTIATSTMIATQCQNNFTGILQNVLCIQPFILPARKTGEYGLTRYVTT